MYRKNLLFHILYFSFWALFCLSSAGYDWDPIHTVMEVDIRVFFEEFGLQKWSYQLNGGMTRYKNLGTHHQSPWFLFFLSLGSYWGVKLFVPFVMTISNFFLVKYLKENLRISEVKSFLFSLIFSLNGFWLLHFYHGHMTYSAQYLYLISILYFYEYLFRGERRNLVTGTILFFGAYSLSVYQILTYMGIPTFFTICALILFLFFKKQLEKKLLKRLLAILICLCASVLVYVSKILSALSYLGGNKRSVRYLEERSFIDVIYSFFLPTKDALSPLFNLQLSPPWGIHEFSYFSFIYVWIIFFGILVFKMGAHKKLIGKYRNETFFIGVSFCISLVLYMGDFIPSSPFRIINDLFFGGGQRVSQRYLLLGVGSLHLFVFYLIGKVDEFKRFQIPFIISCVLAGSIQVYNLINIKDVNYSKAVYRHYTEAIEFNDKMQFVIFPTQQYPQPAYRLIMNNFATIRGFAPVPYKAYIGKDFLESKPRTLIPYFFLRNSNGTELDKNSDCYKNSYFTQIKIIIDKSCPEKLNLLLTNIYSKHKINDYEYSTSVESGITLSRSKR